MLGEPLCSICSINLRSESPVSCVPAPVHEDSKQRKNYVLRQDEFL